VTRRWCVCRSAPTARLRPTRSTPAPLALPACTCCGRCRRRSGGARSSPTQPLRTMPPAGSSSCARCRTGGSCCGSSCGRCRRPTGARLVIEADRATVDAAGGLAGRTHPHRDARYAGARRAADGARRGPNWTTSYDAALGHLALHDPLDDLDALAPNGVVGDALTYVVGGWWSDPQHDPLDGVGSIVGYQERFAHARWEDPDHPSARVPGVAAAESSNTVARMFDLPLATRYATVSPAAQAYRPAVSSSSPARRRWRPSPARRHARTSSPAASTAAVEVDGRPDDRPPHHGRVHVALGRPVRPSARCCERGDRHRRRRARAAATRSGCSPRSPPGCGAHRAARCVARHRPVRARPGLLLDRWRHRAVDRSSTSRAVGATRAGSRPGRRGQPAVECSPSKRTCCGHPVKYPVVLAATEAAKAAGGAKVAFRCPAQVLRSPRSWPDRRCRRAPSNGRRRRSRRRSRRCWRWSVPGGESSPTERDERTARCAGCAPRTSPIAGSTGSSPRTSCCAHRLRRGATRCSRWRARRSPPTAPAAWRQTGSTAPMIYRRGGRGVRMRAEASLELRYYAGDHALLGKITGAWSTPRRLVRWRRGAAKHSLSTGVWAHPRV